MKMTEKIRWGTERRLEFIEFRVYWEGGIRRADLTETFGVSVPQASSDLSLYQELAPGNIGYDSSEKKYVATGEFVPKFCDVSAEKYLAYLKDSAGERLQLADSWMSQIPAAEAMQLPARQVRPEVLKQLVSAVRKKRSIEVSYYSLNKDRAERTWRRISPHAFAFDGMRWHTRAFCHRDGKFKDFVLSRCDGVRAEDAPGRDPKEDQLWNERVTVVLQANPRLMPHQRAALEEDYNMADHLLCLTVRRALLFYLERFLRLDYPDEGVPPEAKPLCVVRVDYLAEPHMIPAS